jgi:hypothetical protein
MFLIEVFLPIKDNQGNPFPQKIFDRIRQELTDRFGGVTAFMRAPAVGLWADQEGKVRRDDIVVFEVMTDALDREWWAACRRRLEAELAQDSILIRAASVEVLG